MRASDTTIPSAPFWPRPVHVVLLVVLLIATTFQAPIYDPAPDAFHEGEYSMYGVDRGHIPSGRPPVLTHGGIDLIPAQAAAMVCRPDHEIVCVRLANSIFTGICEAAFLGVLVLITGLGTVKALVAGLPAFATLIAYNGSTRSAFGLQTGTPNLRELFILLMLVCIFPLFRDDWRISRRGRYALVTAMGFLSGVGLFWIFNRGLFGTLLTVGVAAGLSWLWRDWRPLPLAVAGWLVGLGLLVVTGLYGSVAANFQSMWYFQNDTIVYAMPFDLIAAAGPAIPVYVLLIGWAAVLIWRDLRANRVALTLPLLTLVGVLLFYGYQAHERPFASYVAHTLWGLSLLFGVLFMRSVPTAAGAPRMAALMAVSVVVGIGCTLLNIRFMPPSPSFLLHQLARNAHAMFVEAPKDADLASEGLLQAVAIVRARAPACTYTFSNEGFLYVLSRIPPCSAYAYPFYVGPDRQADAIAQLEQAAPPIVLWASNTWSDAIFDRGLAERTPDVAAWANAYFRYRMVLPGGYELRAREPFTSAECPPGCKVLPR